MASDQNEPDIERPPPEEIKRMRQEHPSGWMQLAKTPARALLIDALIESPPKYEFTPPQIAERAGITAQSVRNHIEALEALGIVEEVSNGNYVLKEKSRVMMELDRLVSAVTAIRSGVAKQTTEEVDPDLIMDNSQVDDSDTDSTFGMNNGPNRMISNAD